MREALSGDGAAAPVRKQEAWAPALTAALQDAEIDTRAILAQAQISLRELVQPGARRHHSHRSAAAGHLVGRRRAGVSRPIRRLAGTQRPENSSRSLNMSPPDPKTAAVARAQFSDLGPQCCGAGGQEMNLNLILDVAVTLALEVGRARMSVRDLLQLAPGAVVELDRLAGEPLDVLVNGVRIARGEVVVVNEKFGIRLTDVVSATERMEHAR